MLEQLRESLEEYIRDGHTLRVQYAGRDEDKSTTFECDLYLLYESKTGGLYVHGYKLSGESEKTQAPHWINLNLELIESIESIGRFVAPLQGYNPRSKMFYKVLFEWELRP